MKPLFLTILLISILLLCGNAWGVNNDARMWTKDVNLNQLLCDKPELRPHYEGYKSNLAVSEYCPNCGAFSYYHMVKAGHRKCCRCESEWDREGVGNIYWERSISYESPQDKRLSSLEQRIEKLEKDK